MSAKLHAANANTSNESKGKGKKLIGFPKRGETVYSIERSEVRECAVYVPVQRKSPQIQLKIAACVCEYERELEEEHQRSAR